MTISRRDFVKGLAAGAVVLPFGVVRPPTQGEGVEEAEEQADEYTQAGYSEGFLDVTVAGVNYCLPLYVRASAAEGLRAALKTGCGHG